MDEGEILRQFEAQFCGRGWSEGKGAHIALHIGELETIAFFRQETTRDQGETETPGSNYDIMMMELDDSEAIINQAKRARAAGVVDPQPKGGPRSKAVAMMLQDPDFQEWGSRRRRRAVASVGDQFPPAVPALPAEEVRQVKMTNEIWDHWDRIAGLGCCICERPAEVAHCHGGSISDQLDPQYRPGMAQKQNHWLLQAGRRRWIPVSIYGSPTRTP
jgi:hypothetical protein